MAAFTCISAIGNIWSNCLSVNVLMEIFTLIYFHKEQIYFYDISLFFLLNLTSDLALLINSKILLSRLLCFLKASPSVTLKKKMLPLIVSDYLKFKIWSSIVLVSFFKLNCFAYLLEIWCWLFFVLQVLKFVKPQLVFCLDLQSFFIYLSNAFPRREYVSLACSIIWLGPKGNISFTCKIFILINFSWSLPL